MLLMVKLEKGFLSDHLHRHHHEITLKMMGLCTLYLPNWQSYPSFQYIFNKQCALCRRQTAADGRCIYLSGFEHIWVITRVCFNSTFIFLFSEMEFPLYLKPCIKAKLQMRYIVDHHYFHFYSKPPPKCKENCVYIFRVKAN